MLEIADVTVRFGGMVALDRVGLHAAAGEVTGLIGPNGAGKTTLFDVVSGIRRARSGSVSLNGEDLSSLAPFQRARRGLTRTFQRVELFGSLTVRDNLAVACAANERAERRNRLSAVHSMLDRLNLCDVADRRADELPTGLGRLVELGRCLMTQPKALLLDEPASGQTEAETQRFAGVLRGLAAEGLIVVLVEHDIALVGDVCDHLVVLDAGRVIASGAPAAILKDAAVQVAYLGPVRA